MRVPLVTMPTVGQQASPTSAPNLVQPDYSAARVTNTIGNALIGSAGQLVGAAEQRYAEGQQRELEATKKVREEAEDVAVTEAIIELDGKLEARQGEFFKTKGLSASEARAKALEEMRGERERLAESFSSTRASQKFRQRSAERLMGAARQVETHVGREYEAARSGALKGLEDSAVGKAEAGALDPAEFSVLEADVIKSIRDTQRSEAEGTARIADFQSRMAAGLAQGLVAQGRTEEAAEYVRKARATLGARYVEAQGLVDRANAGAEKDRQIAEGAKLVAGTYESLRQEGHEYVPEDKLRAAIKLDETDPGVRAEVERALEKQVREEQQRLRADIDKERDNANRADLEGKPIPGATMAFLTKYDPDFLLARQARLRAEARAAKASRSGDKSARAAELAAQKAVDQEFLLRLQTELVNDPSTKPEDFLQAFIAEKAKEGEDVTVSDVARAKAGLDAAKAGKKVETGELSAERSAAKRFEATIAKATPKVKGKPINAAQLNERVGKALQLYRERTEAKGKPLDEAELAAIEAEVVREAVVETPREVFGIPLGTSKKKVMGVDLLQPGGPPVANPPEGAAVPLGKPRTATGKNGEKYRLSADGKSWELIK